MRCVPGEGALTRLLQCPCSSGWSQQPLQSQSLFFQSSNMIRTKHQCTPIPFSCPTAERLPPCNEVYPIISVSHPLGQLNCTFSPKDGKKVNRWYLSEELLLLNVYSWKIYLQSPKTADPGFFQSDYYVFSALSPSKDDQRKVNLNSGVGRSQITWWKQSLEVGVKIQYTN